MQKISLFLCLLILSSCKVGPNFRSPEAPKNINYNQGSTLKKTVAASSPAGTSQRLRYRQDISSSWWRIFHSKEINALIEQGLKNNPSVEMSKANLRKAQANLIAVAGPELFPTASTQFLASRERNTLIATGINLAPLPGQKLPFKFNNQFDLYSNTITVSYNLDLFGGTRRQLEALRAAIDYERFELEATYLALTGNIVTTSIAIASLQDQLTTTQALIDCQHESLKLTKQNYRLGHFSRMEVLESEKHLKAFQANLPPLKSTLAKKYNALAVLVGSLPSESNLPHFNLKSLHFPSELPVSLPSELVRQRPDIRSAESILHKASAEIGVATANLFPKFNLLGDFGWFSTTLSTLFNPMNNVWNYAGQVAQTLLKGGSLRAKRKMAIAEYEFSLAQYRKVMVEAFVDVANVLHALEFDAELLQAQADSEKNALLQFNLIKTQYQLGRVTQLAVLKAKAEYLKSHLNVIQAEAARYNDTAALFQSLGGGWWNRDLPIG
ncbi:efflux transporter outer membrane subunit [Legionella sp. 227]|uniref:efflux transporter outer membrane subunit n=1 Tax=Legionella sp. 227 TaxID=3367288 RepID=UPI00370D7CE2